MALRLGNNLPRSNDQKIIGLHPLAVIASFLIRLAAIHLLPFAPFDGSRLLRSSLSRRYAKLICQVGAAKKRHTLQAILSKRSFFIA